MILSRCRTAERVKSLHFFVHKQSLVFVYPVLGRKTTPDSIKDNPFKLNGPPEDCVVCWGNAFSPKSPWSFQDANLNKAEYSTTARSHPFMCTPKPAVSALAVGSVRSAGCCGLIDEVSPVWQARCCLPARQAVGGGVERQASLWFTQKGCGQWTLHLWSLFSWLDWLLSSFVNK